MYLFSRMRLRRKSLLMSIGVHIVVFVWVSMLISFVDDALLSLWASTSSLVWPMLLWWMLLFAFYLLVKLFLYRIKEPVAEASDDPFVLLILRNRHWQYIVRTWGDNEDYYPQWFDLWSWLFGFTVFDKRSLRRLSPENLFDVISWDLHTYFQLSSHQEKAFYLGKTIIQNVSAHVVFVDAIDDQHIYANHWIHEYVDFDELWTILALYHNADMFLYHTLLKEYTF